MCSKQPFEDVKLGCKRRYVTPRGSAGWKKKFLFLAKAAKASSIFSDHESLRAANTYTTRSVCRESNAVLCDEENIYRSIKVGTAAARRKCPLPFAIEVRIRKHCRPLGWQCVLVFDIF